MSDGLIMVRSETVRAIGGKFRRWDATCLVGDCWWTSELCATPAEAQQEGLKHLSKCPHYRIKRALDLADEIEQAVERNQEKRLTPMFGAVLVSDATLREDIAVRKTARRIAAILRGEA